MFERFTQTLRSAIFLATEEARQAGSASIEPEHLLLGFLRADMAVAKRFLGSEAAAESARKGVEARGGLSRRAPASTSRDLPLSEPSKRVLAFAAEEAERLAHAHIGTEHLLLGMLREEKGLVAEILRALGLRPSAVRGELDQSPEPRIGIERFTQTARIALLLARESAILRGSGRIDPEDFLSGILRASPDIERYLGLAPGTIEGVIWEFRFRRSEPWWQKLPDSDVRFSPQVRGVLTTAADMCPQRHIGIWNLLLAFLSAECSRFWDGTQYLSLSSRGIDLENAKLVADRYSPVGAQEGVRSSSPPEEHRQISLALAKQGFLPEEISWALHIRMWLDLIRGHLTAGAHARARAEVPYEWKLRGLLAASRKETLLKANSPTPRPSYVPVGLLSDTRLGLPSLVSFPPICPCCLETADTTVRLAETTKAGYRQYTLGVDIPYCTHCKKHNALFNRRPRKPGCATLGPAVSLEIGLGLGVRMGDPMLMTHASFGCIRPDYAELLRSANVLRVFGRPPEPPGHPCGCDDCRRSRAWDMYKSGDWARFGDWEEYLSRYRE